MNPTPAAARAGFGADPAIAWSGSSSAASLLAAAGFTDVTEIDLSDLDTADLSSFDVLFVSSIGGSGGIGDQALADAAEANVASFAAAGGGIVTEDLDSYAWLPMGDSLGVAGNSDDNMKIVATGHATMAGLTGGGLSGWGQSSHRTFGTPGVFTTVVISTDSDDLATLIVFEGAVPTAGVAWLLALTLLLTLAGAAVLRRRAIA